MTAARKLRRTEGERQEERSSSLTNSSSRSNEKEPASGRRQRRESDLYGPWSTEPEMETYFHVSQIVLLFSGLRWAWRDRTDYFATANMSVFYTVLTEAGNKVMRKVKFRGPDFFVALNPRPLLNRRSWVVENEGKYPDVIVEVLSLSTKKNDRGEKKLIYEQTFRTPEYFLFDPKTDTLEGFRLVDGRYEAIVANAHGHLWSEKLGMALGLHYDSAATGKVARYFTADGQMVAIAEEEALEAQRVLTKAREDATKAREDVTKAREDVNEARSTAARETARARQAETKADKLAEKLRSLGVDPDKLA